MTSEELVEALIKDNSLASEFDRLNLWGKLNSLHWRNLLSALPQFWIYCPKESVKKIKEDPNKAKECKCLNKISHAEWCKILSIHPSLADKCKKWRWFDSWDWRNLLKAQPQFADKCTEYEGWEKFNSWEWSYLLSTQSQFIEKAKEYLYGWAGLLSIKPELANECKCWGKFNSLDCGILLSSQPQLWIYCPEASVKKIEEDPNKAEECKCWDWIDSENWSNLLSSQPQFANKCNWIEMRANNYDEYYDEYYDDFEDYGDDDFEDWKAECGEDYSEDWKNLLLKQPQLAEYFTAVLWDGFSQEQWNELEAKHPGVFEDKHMLSTLRKLAK